MTLFDYVLGDVVVEKSGDDARLTHVLLTLSGGDRLGIEPVFRRVVALVAFSLRRRDARLEKRSATQPSKGKIIGTDFAIEDKEREKSLFLEFQDDFLTSLGVFV